MKAQSKQPPEEIAIASDEVATAMSLQGRCCVFQPFDRGGPHDKRYDDTIAPAIREAGLEPYRVDRDDGAVILIETLHDEIKAAAICLADITTTNPNVMYELGYAIASGKDVVIICASQQSGTFPFDIRHRKVISYNLDSASDFDVLKKAIISHIKSILARQAATEEIASVSPVKSTHGLQPNEVAALALIMANADSLEDWVPANLIRTSMDKVGYTGLATRLAISRLSELSFVKSKTQSDKYGNKWVVYGMQLAGEQWLLQNQGRLELRVRDKKSVQDEDDPFGGVDNEVRF